MIMDNWQWMISRACNADLREQSVGARSDARHLIIVAPDDVALFEEMQRRSEERMSDTTPFVIED